jgi:acyl carrier protein
LIDQDPTLVTHHDLLSVSADERVRLVESYLLASIRALRPGDAPFDASTRLADLAIDSIQVVELKFGLDQLIGRELDVDVIISNPTIRELAETSLRASGLLAAEPS